MIRKQKTFKEFELLIEIDKREKVLEKTEQGELSRKNRSPKYQKDG